MNFIDVIKDLVKMEGLCLQSIRPGAEITIEKVDVDQKRITVRNAAGKVQNRYFAELERIWDALLSNAAICVEEVLNGSGSSRNQPETIFANLPYVQWLKIDNKKHIAYVGKPTHPFGTIQQMDGMQAVQIANSAKGMSLKQSIVLIAVDNVAQTAKTITALTGKAGCGNYEGYYTYDLKGQCLVLIDYRKANIPCGTYPEIISGSRMQNERMITLLGHTWGVICEDALKAIVRSQP